MSVWISAIGKYYGGAVGVLGTRGLFIVNDNLPIRRMWHESNAPTPLHRYFDCGLYNYQRDEGPVVGNLYYNARYRLSNVAKTGYDDTRGDLRFMGWARAH